MALVTQSSQVMTVGKYLLDRLESYGVRHIFGVPGDYVLRLDKLIEEHTIAFVNTTQENTAGYMADLYGRMHGLGVACITYGVGIGIANAMAQAYVESSPLVIISGAAGSQERQKHSYLHHLINKKVRQGRDRTQLDIFRLLTVDQAVITNAHDAAKEIERVLNSCLTYKKPVYIELPRDLVMEHFPGEEEREIAPQFSRPHSDGEALKEALDEFVKLLKESRQPCIWLGHEVQRFGLLRPLLSLAERLHIPIVTSILGKGAISERHPLFVGVYQGAMSLPTVRSFVEDCDLLLCCGVLFSDVNTGIFSTQLDHQQKVIATVEQVKINHHRYQEVSFVDFMTGLAHLDLNLRFRIDYPACIDRAPITFTAAADKKITTERFFQALQHSLRPDHILVTDIGDSLFGSTDLVVEQNAFYACAYFASMGFGIPAAIAAQLLAPKKRVLAIVGDGAFQMTATELSTAVRYQVDPIVLVLNNHGFGTERPILEGGFNDIVNWRYAELPRLLGGGWGRRVTTEEELENSLHEALEKRGSFCLIEVELDKGDYSSTMRRFNKLVHP